MWNELKIEKHALKLLKKKLGSDNATKIFSIYTSARKVLVEDILPEIKAVLPRMTDHSQKHVAHVLEQS